MKPNPVDLHAVWGSLKDFQRRTAEFAFEQLVLNTDSTRRFLVADEVGLGKTLVARGIVARLINHLWENQQIDIIYVCSNKDIARQNLARLKVTEDDGFVMATRLTLLARNKVKRAGVSSGKQNKLNFVSLTPGTSFDPQGNKLGDKSERVLLYYLLKECWGVSSKASQNVLQGRAENFFDEVRQFPYQYVLDPVVLSLFDKELAKAESSALAKGQTGLRDRFDDLCQRFPRAREYRNIPSDDRTDRDNFVAELRILLAQACVHALSPDLVILDEFQRFRELLDEGTEAGQLAHALFNYVDDESKAHVLLLSATPYKMYTVSEEAVEDNHYEDFLNTLRFLLNDKLQTEQVAQLLQEFRRELIRDAGKATPRLRELRKQIQDNLKRVMVRTERLANNLDRNGMLTEVVGEVELAADDLRAYCEMQKIAEIVDVPDLMEYWKSAPYLLNFMDDYELKREFLRALDDPIRAAQLQATLSASKRVLLSEKKVKNGEEVAPQNARLRRLIKDMTESGAWKLLWLPPTLPYYQPGGAFAAPSARALTKRLVFSSWRMVPKVIASLVSHEVDRRAREQFKLRRGVSDVDGGQSSLLRFSRDRDRRLTGMPIFSLLYPSSFLAKTCDPLRIACELESEGQEATLTSVRERAQRSLQDALAPWLKAPANGPEDERWYWAAPILLDLHAQKDATLDWLRQKDLANLWTAGKTDEDPDSAWSEHVNQLLSFAENPQLGSPPDDLLEVLTTISIGGPANCVMRALSRVAEDAHVPEQELRSAAAMVGWSFRGHFNRPHAITIIRAVGGAEPYWRSVLNYCVDGCLQSVLDEYVHILKEALGLLHASSTDAIESISHAISDVLTLRPSNLKIDFFSPNARNQVVQHREGRMIARFALPLVEAQEEAEQDSSRIEKVKQAFNSPFWPFVVASTAIGQEGLDFHSYCHAIVHWNLPSNPVDMEQREGRIHRYKGHAIRKNISKRYSLKVKDTHRDPWAGLFEQASIDRAMDQNDLIPFWIYPIEDGARIERHVPAPPLSRDEVRLQALRRTMALYRLVFGQPRQDDLLQYIIERNPTATDEDLARMCSALNIDLSP